MINHCSTTAYQLTPRVLFHAPCAMLHFSTIGSRYMARIAMHHFVATNNMSAHQGRGPNYTKKLNNIGLCHLTNLEVRMPCLPVRGKQSIYYYTPLTMMVGLFTVTSEHIRLFTF